jgi:hypothetical protein
MTGERQKYLKAPKAAKPTLIKVGPKDKEIDIIKSEELDDYLTESFYRLYDIFEKYELGFGLPLDKTWPLHPKWMIDTISLFKSEYSKIKR